MKSLPKTLIAGSLIFSLQSGCGLIDDFSRHAGPSDSSRHEGRLAPCPDQPNCVSTQMPDGKHGIVPFTYSKGLDEARSALKKELLQLPRVELIKEDGVYLHFEQRSRILQLVDDIEFIFDEPTKTLQFRSGSRIGHSDWGNNRKRMEEIRNKILGRI